MQKITPCLWFNNNTEEAVALYTSVFPNSKTGRVTHYDAAGAKVSGMPEGSILTIEFELDGQKFMALNGGPIFKFSEAVSFVINCDTQEEIDHYWNKLGEGGDPAAQVCGWLKDKFGVSWQVTPKIVDDMIADPDKEKAGRAMAAMLQMKKLDIEELKKAYNG